MQRVSKGMVLSALVAVGLILVLTVSASTAFAANPRAAGRHCVVALEPLQPGAEQSEVVGQECFATFPEAIFHATEGRVRLSEADDAKAQLENLDLELKTAQADLPPVTANSFVISVIYNWTNYGGGSHTFTGVSACSSSVSYGVTSMPGGWNDAEESTRGYSNCNNNHVYEHTNYTGANLVCRPDCSTLGVLNNAVSSQRWYF